MNATTGPVKSEETQAIAFQNLLRRADEQSVLFRFTDRLYRAASIGDVYAAALESIIVGLGCKRASILLFDADGVMQFVASEGLSEGYRRAVTGHTPWTPGQRDAAPFSIADSAELEDGLRQTIQQEGIGALAFVPLELNGGVIGKFMAYHDAPHTFEAEEIDLALTIARQIGFAIERERAREFRAGADDFRQRMSAIVENSNDAIISKNLNGIIQSWNKGAERLFGYAADEIIGKSILTLFPAAYQDEEPDIIGRITRDERIEHYETVRQRKDGQHIHISLTVSPIKDAQGRIVGASKIARDITERKRADQQRALLVNELNHRVKNTLATVQSLAMQTLRGAENNELARAMFESRLAALSRAHDLLTNENWEGAGLRDVVERALAPFRPEESGRIAVGGPHVRLTPKQALALSIAIHELATNAVKYGALSNQSGKVAVQWSVAAAPDGGALELTWTESGGPDVAPPARVGFGSRLIQRGLALELGGEARIEYRPAGVVAVITTSLEGARGSL